MKLTVVTVTWNSAAHIDDALRSVDAQVLAPFEHLIIDGGSTDDTMMRVRADAKPWRHAVSERDRGIYDAMNKGLRRSTGDAIGFLNSDDMYADVDVLRRVADAFSDPEVDAVYGDLVLVDAADTSRVVRYWKSRPCRPGLCESGWAPPHPTLFVRRSVYQRLGDFDESLRIAADYEMALRLFHVARVRSVHIPAILVRMRIGGTSTRGLKSVIAGNREASRAARMHGLPGGWRFVLRKVGAKLPQLLRRPGDGVG